jgi:hypothetical protein
MSRKKWNGSPGPFSMKRNASKIRLKPNPLWNVRASLKSGCGFSRRVSENVAKLVRVSEAGASPLQPCGDESEKVERVSRPVLEWEKNASKIRLKPNPLWNVRASLKSGCGFRRRISENVAKLVRGSEAGASPLQPCGDESEKVERVSRPVFHEKECVQDSAKAESTLERSGVAEKWLRL